MSALLIEVVLKGSILMTAAAAAVVLLVRASAATRHFVWTLAVAGLLLLPVFALARVRAVLPSWEIAVPIASSEITEPIDLSRAVTAAQSIPVAVTDGTAAVSIESESSSVAARLPWVLLPALVYALGVFALLLRLAVHHTRGRRLTRDAAIVSDPEWKALLEDCAVRIGVQRQVTLFRSRVQLIPVTTGTIAPAIVIPADADTWGAERRAALAVGARLRRSRQGVHERHAQHPHIEIQGAAHVLGDDGQVVDAPQPGPAIAGIHSRIRGLHFHCAVHGFSFER